MPGNTKVTISTRAFTGFGSEIREVTHEIEDAATVDDLIELLKLGDSTRPIVGVTVEYCE